MKKLVEEKIKKIVEENSENWLLNQFVGEEDEVEVSGALKEIFEDENIEISFENVKYLFDVIIHNTQLDKELEDADE